MSEAMWAGIGALVVAVLGAIGVLSKKVFSMGRVGRADAIKEWQTYADRLERKIDSNDVEIKSLRDKNEKENRDWYACYSACQKETTELRGEVRLLTATVQRLQGLTGDVPIGQDLPGLFITDIHGKIKEFSPSLTPMLHWLPGEIKGRNVRDLMVDEGDENVVRELTKLETTGRPPWDERVILTSAVNKRGDRVLVTASLTCWQTEKGDWMISVQLRRRPPQPLANITVV